ncbi:MAG: hypothetical protein IK071_00180, partial [Lachnospiraceae bacterium]|nr:hypothetical protein [Lachnospiraceae bacterium]
SVPVFADNYHTPSRYRIFFTVLYIKKWAKFNKKPLSFFRHMPYVYFDASSAFVWGCDIKGNVAGFSTGGPEE